MEGNDGSARVRLACGGGAGSVQVNGKAATLQVGVCRAIIAPPHVFFVAREEREA